MLLSRDNYTLFTPMLPEVTSGELEVRHVVTPIREQLSRTRFVLAEVEAIDVDRPKVSYRHVLTGAHVDQPYDQLVLALGIVDVDLRDFPASPSIRGRSRRSTMPTRFATIWCGCWNLPTRSPTTSGADGC